MRITDMNGVLNQFNALAMTGHINDVAGIVMNPNDLEYLRKHKHVKESANKNDQSGEKLVGFPVSSASCILVGRIMWIGENYRVIAITGINGIEEETKDEE